MQSYADELLKQALLLSASGLGVCFAILYRISRQIVKATYEERSSFLVTVDIVLGLIGGTILSQLIPIGTVGDLGTLTTPTLALLGGFSASAVFRILTKIVESVEGLFSPGAEEKLEATQERAEADITSTRAAITNALVQARNGPNLGSEIDNVISRLVRGEEF